MNDPQCSLTSQRTPGKNPHTEVFKDIIRSAGIILGCNENKPNILIQEQALVVRNISIALNENTNIRKFLAGFQLLIKKETYFKKALLPTQFKKPSFGKDVAIQQESLFRIFLNVHPLQEKIIDILIEEITSATIEETENQDSSWLRLLLNQLRYLSHIKNSDVLTTKMLDILEVASFPSQLEILDSIPEILPDSEHINISKKLTEMLLQKDELDAAIIDCLNAFQLTTAVRAEIQDHILSKIITRASSKVFPIFLDFLLTDQKSQHLASTFIKIRNALDSIMASNDSKKDNENESNKIVILNRLQSLTSSKPVGEAWLNVISAIKLHSDHKPVDLLLLLVLHTSTTVKKRTIELIFRKRIKESQFKCSLLEQFFDKYLPSQILKDYFASIIEIGCSLLRTSTEPTITEFASTLFYLLFNHCHKEIAFRQELIDSLILLTSAQNHKNTGVILKIFYNLLEDITKIQHHTVLLMRLLERLDAFELKHIKMVFEILCKLTCSDDALSGLKQEIHMIIRKQLSSSKRTIKHRGIIGAVVMAKNIATTLEDQSEIEVSENSVLTVAQLAGNAQEAAAILELANTSTTGTAELLGLYYDELTSMLRTAENLDKYFLTWLFETVTNDFQNIFISENVATEMTHSDLEISMQFNLNSNDEIETPISVNIAELCLVNKEHAIVQLAPHFRLLRLLHWQHQNGDLSSIDALLGCGISLPRLTLIHDTDFQKGKQLADCIFHCINWFREVISGFVSQKSKILRRKVVQRLENLIEFECLLSQCLTNMPDHRFPVSHFDKLTQAGVKANVSPSKSCSKVFRVNKKARSNDTTANVTIPSTSKAKTSKRVIQREISFREIDFDIVLLLKYPLEKEEMIVSSNSDNITLTNPQLNFVLKDFVTKLHLITKNQVSGLSHLSMITPENLIKDCAKILPNIRRHFNTITDQINDLLKTTDGRHDLPEMFTDTSIELKATFGLTLESLALMVGWTGFQHAKNFDLLREILKSFRSYDKSEQTPSSVNRLIFEFGTHLSDYVEHCLHLKHAVHLIEIMETLYLIMPGHEIRTVIVKASGRLLLKRWYNETGGLDTGKIAAIRIDLLLKSYLSSADIKTICGLVGTLQTEAEHLKSKTDCLQMLASVDKLNFYIFYRNLCNALHLRIKLEAQSQLTNREHLSLWRTTALTMQGLMTVVKAQETKSNLVCFLKKSIAILKVFLSHGIPILEIMLKAKPDQVVEIFKTIQLNTRFLHHLCCYSKLNKDSGLLAYVPHFRLTLETLVYRVKAALVANDCSAAFWMGNLRNRDLQGHDIPSQSSTTTSGSGIEEEEEEEVSDHDDDESEIFEEEENVEGNHSGSEVFE